MSPQNRPTVEEEEKPTITGEEMAAIIAQVPLPQRALFVVLALTGLRIGEVLGLKWRDLDSARGLLYIRRSVWAGRDQSLKTKKSERAKVVGATLKQALELHRMLSHYTDDEDYIFANGAGRPLNPDDLRKRVLYPAMDAAGITRTARAYGFHLFRHSAGSALQELTGDIKKTSSFLGHGSTTTTGDVYLHVTPDAERSDMEKLETALFPAGISGNLLANVSKSDAPVN